MQTKKIKQSCDCAHLVYCCYFNGRNSHRYLVCSTRVATRFNCHRRWTLYWWFDVFLCRLHRCKNPKSAMQTVQISFGEKGSALFSLLNAMQLMGWTAVMIYMGAEVISILNQTADASIFPFLTLGLGILIILWLLLGFTKLGIFKSLSLVTMFLLMLWLSIQVANKPFIAMDAAQKY